MSKKTEERSLQTGKAAQAVDSVLSTGATRDVPAIKSRRLPEAAKRALAEAAERRKQMDCRPEPPREINGRKGPDPVRYGDWENKGITSDF